MTRKLENSDTKEVLAALHKELYLVLCGDVDGKNLKKSGYMYNWLTLLYGRD